MTRQTETPPNLRLHGTRRKRRAPEAGRYAARDAEWNSSRDGRNRPGPALQAHSLMRSFAVAP